MPSPFPGMDPYLEEPGLWPDVHHELISEVRAELSRLLRPKYFVRVEERVYVTDENDPGLAILIPDVRVAYSPRYEARHYSPPDDGGLATEVEVEPVEVLDSSFPEIHEARLEVLDRADRQVVTVIEILSPSNKVLNSRGRDQYQKKRDEILDSPAHLVEIDLLRSGAPMRRDSKVAPHHYSVTVSRSDRRRSWIIWPIRLENRLPTIAIPLKGDDPDAPLNLQQVLNTSYERAAYDADIDYSQPPNPPLPADYLPWADKLIAAVKSRA